MEGLPTTTENESEKKDFSIKKKKKAEAFGALLVEPKTESDSARADAHKSLWETLTKQNKSGESESGALPIFSQEATEASEIEAPLEGLSTEEKQFIESQIAQSPPESLDREVTSGETEDNELPALENFRHKIVVEGKDSEQAFTETLDELGVERPLINEENETEVSDTLPSYETDAQAEPSIVYSLEDEFNNITAQLKPSESQLDIASPAEIEHNAAHEQAGGSGAGSPPPPTERAEGWSEEPPNSNSFVEAAPSSPATNKEYVPQYQEGNPAAAALLGGIIGYLIGRRRGRIKTEKRLLPVQEKLEKEVVDLEWEIRRKETVIRKAAAQRNWEQRSRTKETQAVEAGAATLQGSQHENRTKENVTTEKHMPEKRQFEQRSPAPEANQLHGKRSPELIGQVLLSAGAKTAKKLEASSVEKIEMPKRIETLNRAELLNMSEKIIVDGSSLREVYETKLIGEHGLRRLVAEHLSGGNIKKALRREIVEREIDYERDPILRDHQPSTDNSGGGTSLRSLLQKAGTSIEDDDSQNAFYEARAHYEAEKQTVATKQRRVVDFGLAGIITVLTVLVAILLITRS